MGMAIGDRIRAYVPKQLEVHLIGTLKSQVQRGVFYFSLYNFAQILFISWTSGAYGNIFPNLWVYFLAHGAGFGAIVALDYVLVLPGEKDYQKRQDYLRDPLRADIQALQEQITDLQKQLEEQE